MTHPLPIDAILADEPVMPVQFHARGLYVPPERRLLLAMLEQAQTDLRKGGAVRADAVDWVLGRLGGRWVFSFENVCGFLGWDAGLTRNLLLLPSDVTNVM